MDKADKQLILATLESPGWELIVKRAQDRIERVKLAALANTDETKFLDLYRKAHAAQSALLEWTEDLKAITEGE